ncbi:MAG: hypothetical protein WBO45_20405 [Planctomycetota bacterium]
MTQCQRHGGVVSIAVQALLHRERMLVLRQRFRRAPEHLQADGSAVQARRHVVVVAGAVDSHPQCKRRLPGRQSGAGVARVPQRITDHAKLGRKPLAGGIGIRSVLKRQQQLERHGPLRDLDLRRCGVEVRGEVLRGKRAEAEDGSGVPDDALQHGTGSWVSRILLVPLARWQRPRTTSP